LPVVAELLPGVPDEEVEALCAPVYAFIEAQLANGDADDARRLCDWFANLVQHPGRKSCIAPILHGSVACGHKRFVDWVRLRLIGSEHSLTGAKKATDFVDKFLIHIDSDARMDAMIKSHVTHPTLVNRAWRTVPSRLNVIYTTRSVVTADPEWTGWRCSVFRCSDAPCSPDFEAYLDSPRVQRAFYQALLRHDISHYSVTWWSDYVPEFAPPRGAYGMSTQLHKAPRACAKF
jgi:hypothetical protein